MTGLGAWWRRTGGFMAALVLTVLTFGPSLDAFICRDEGGLTAAAAELPSATAQDIDHSMQGHDNGLGTCVHGHCHHGAAYTPVDGLAASTPTLAVGRHVLLRVSVPTSDPKFGLMRPPRA